MGVCAFLMWFYGFWNNVAVPRPSVATNAWNFSMTLFLSFQVNSALKCFLCFNEYERNSTQQNLKTGKIPDRYLIRIEFRISRPHFSNCLEIIYDREKR